MLAELLFGGAKKLAHDTGPLSDFWYGRVSQPVASQVTVNEDTAMTYSAVWAATRLIAGTAGRLPLNLYRRRRGGGRDIMHDDRRHRLVHFRPNNEMAAMLFRSSQVAYQVNWGNSYSEIQRVGTMPVGLWPIHPSRVTVMRDADTDALVYKVKKNVGVAPIFIPAKDMLHTPSMMSPNGITGLGVIEYARESIGFGMATERHGASFFGSGAIPLVVIKHPQTLTTEARKEFRKEWKKLYSGPTGDKTALLQEGMDVVPLNLSQKDSQFLETRQHNIEEIARWYGVPPHMLQHLLRATFSNIEHQSIEFVAGLILWLKIWEQELAAKLLTEEEQADHFFEFQVTALLRGDSAARSAFYQVLLTLGIFTIDEVRELEGLNPVPGGNTRYIQGAMMPIGPDGMLIPPVKPEPPEPEGDDEGDNLAARFEESALNVEASIARLQGDIAGIHTPAVADGNGQERDELDKREACMKVAARLMLGQATGRIIRRHAQAARSAAKAPGKFLEWNDAFAGKVTSTFLKELEPCLQAFHAIGIEANADAIVATHLTQAREELLEASGAPQAEFAESIEACVSNWEECRAQAMADTVYQLTIGE